MKALDVRRAARLDMFEALDRYRSTAGETSARKLAAAFAAALESVATSPHAGSAGLGELLYLPNLRSRQVIRFPYSIFYVGGAEPIPIVRVLHHRRDVASLLELP